MSLCPIRHGQQVYTTDPCNAGLILLPYLLIYKIVLSRIRVYSVKEVSDIATAITRCKIRGVKVQAPAAKEAVFAEESRAYPN